MLQHCNPLEKSKTWFGSVYFNLCKFVLTFFYTAVLLSLARGFPSVSWVPRDAHERIVIGLLECFADSKSSLLDTLAKWFKLWICKLDSPHLLAILASFYLRQSNQSRYSRNLVTKNVVVSFQINLIVHVLSQRPQFYLQSESQKVADLMIMIWMREKNLIWY